MLKMALKTPKMPVWLAGKAVFSRRGGAGAPCERAGQAASVAITASGTARVVLAGVWQKDLLEPGKRQRHIHTRGDALATVLRSLGKGLAANPALPVAALGQQPIALDCPALENDGQLPANARACELPARIDAAAWGAQLPKGDAVHVVQVLAITEKTVSPQPTDWGIGPGIGTSIE